MGLNLWELGDLRMELKQLFKILKWVSEFRAKKVTFSKLWREKGREVQLRRWILLKEFIIPYSCSC